MPATAILSQAKTPRQVSDNLDDLADQHPPVSSELLVLSGNVRRSAALLEVLVAMKMGPGAS
jgi:hypothetical protein